MQWQTEHMGRIEHGPKFYFGVLASFIFNNYIWNMGDFILGSWHLLVLLLTILITSFQLVKWKDLLHLSDAQCLCMLYVFILYNFLQWNWFFMFPFSVVVFFLFQFCCLETMVKLFNILEFFSNLHQKYEILNFFCRDHY
jgi:hypothetical protein